MKKITSLLASFILVLALTHCKKESSSNQLITTDVNSRISDVRQKIMSQVLNASKNPEIRAFVLSECLKQKHGDYNVYLKDVTAEFKGKPGYEKFISNLEPLIAQSKTIEPGQEPLIFYPRAETIEASLKLKGNKSAPSLQQVSADNLKDPIGVFQNVYYSDYSTPGYIVDDGNTLSFVQNITEAYAWENDVWVIGEEENVSPENLVAATEDMTPNISKQRVEGQAEYGAIIQCTDLNQIEHWTSGKLEFTFYVFNSSGVKVGGRPWGKFKRSHFTDQKWKDFVYFIGNWNTSTYGRWMYENWWEEDGGASNATTISFPAQNGAPAISTTIPSQNRDDDLGLTTIQFTDQISQIYNLAWMNIKRRN